MAVAGNIINNHYVYIGAQPERGMDEMEAPLVPLMPSETTETTPTLIADGKGGRRPPEPEDAPLVPDLR